MSTTAPQPILRIGILGDQQAYADRHAWGMHNHELACQLLAPMNLDALVMTGDLSDQGWPQVYPLYMQILRECFGEHLPVHVPCAGNHDYWATCPKRPFDELYADFCTGLEESVVNPICKTIKGYDFIAMSSDHDHKFATEEECAVLAEAIDRAVARDSGKPIFVITHYNPSRTTSGSYGENGLALLRKTLDRYPQVISLSGHTHIPLEDERTIWQGAFTAINTSSLAYACVEERCANTTGPIVPFARDAIQCLRMDVFSDHIEVHRYNVTEAREIKPEKPWRFRLPYDPRHPELDFDSRAATRTAPRFPANAFACFRYDYGYFYLIFDAAVHDDFTHWYRVAITEKNADGTDGKTQSFRYISDFYRLKRHIDPRVIIKLPPHSIVPGQTYRFDIYPVETFGHEGAPLSFDYTVACSARAKNAPDSYPQE